MADDMITMKFTYKNDTPSFEKVMPSVKGWDSNVMEIVVDGNDGNKRRIATAEYIASMISAFRNLVNMDELEIESFKYHGTLIGDVSTVKEKMDELNKLNNGIKFYDFVVFNLYDPAIKEMLYVTRNSENITSGDVGIAYENQKLNAKVIDSESDESRLKQKIAGVVTTLHKFLPDYEAIYDESINQFTYFYKGVPLSSIEDIIDDDIFLFFKLVEVTFNRGKHVGVYFIDCNLFSSYVIHAFISYINAIYLSNRTIFLYNVSNLKRKQLSELHHEVIKVPNHKQSKNVKNK